jgi:hypothetical protein
MTEGNNSSAGNEDEINRPELDVDVLSDGRCIPAIGDDALWALTSALHSNVPEDQRPMSWSDFSPEQIERLRLAAKAFLGKYILNEPQAPSMRAALEPFAKYEMIAVGFNGCFSKEDLKDCTWVAGFKGPQPEFRHFQNARDALALSRPQGE